MQTFRKSKSRLLSGLLLLALIMYYLYPNGHFLTGHISAPIVGVDTRVVCMSPTSLPSGAGRKYKQNLVLKQRMGPASKKFSPFTSTGSWAWPGRTAFYPFLCPWVFLCKILKPRLLQTPTHLLGVPNAYDPFATAGSCLPCPLIPSALAAGT